MTRKKGGKKKGGAKSAQQLINEGFDGSKQGLAAAQRQAKQGNRGGGEFIADFIDNKGELQRHHEVSVFERHKGRWYYTDGRVQVRPVNQAQG